MRPAPLRPIVSHPTDSQNCLFSIVPDSLFFPPFLVFSAILLDIRAPSSEVTRGGRERENRRLFTELAAIVSQAPVQEAALRYTPN